MDEQARVGYLRVDETQNAVIVRVGDKINGKTVKRVEFAEPVFHLDEARPNLTTKIIIEDGYLGEKEIEIEHTSLQRR